MKTTKSTIVLFSIICSVLLFGSVCFAGVRGNVRGYVHDTQGNPIAGVKITIQSLRISNEIYEIETGEDGRFSYVGLKPYLYKVTFELKGYQTYIEPEFKIRAGHWVEMDVTLLTIAEVKKQAIEDMTPEQRAALYFNDALDLFNNSDFDKAVEKFNLAIENNPSLTRAHELKGIIYYTKKNDPDSARSAFEAAVVADSSSTTSYEFLGAIADKAGDEAKAVEYWNKYFELGGDSGIVAENLARIFLTKNDFSAARKVLERGIEGESEYGPLYKKLGDSCMRLNDFPAALEAYKKYLELSPDASDKPMIQAFIDALEKATKKEEAPQKQLPN
ncbi:tetratricopeptide repeat protein [bacterium]|nr:tetratricopeptide repeat protein [bacterium]